MRKLGQHIVDRVFDERLSQAEMPVPGKMWGNIASELEKDELRRKVIWYRSIAAASVLLLVGLGTWMLIQPAFTSKQFAGAQRIFHQVNLPSFAEGTCYGTASQLAEKENPHLQPANLAVSKNNMETVQDRELVNVQDDPKLTSIAEGIPADKVANALKAAMNGTKIITEAIAARTPSLLPTIVKPRTRQILGDNSRENGVFAGLLNPKSQSKEKEYNFVLDEEDLAEEAPRRWEVGAGFSPDMSFASTTPLEQTSRSTSALADDPTQANVNRLSPVMAYAAVVRTSFEFDDRWSIRAGLSCMNRQTSTVAELSTSGKNSTTYQSNLNLYSLEIPLSVKYNVVHQDNFDYYVTSGVSGNFFLHYDNYLQTSDGNIASRRSSQANEAFKPSQASLLLSTGLRYRLFEHLSLQLEPGLRYGVLRNQYAFSLSRPVSTSLLSGLTYHF